MTIFFFCSQKVCVNCLAKMKNYENSESGDIEVIVELQNFREGSKSMEIGEHSKSGETQKSSASEVSDESSGDVDTDHDTPFQIVQTSSVNECLQILGESPLKPVSKATLKYTTQKIVKVQSTLKRRILDLSQREEEEETVRVNIIKSFLKHIKLVGTYLPYLGTCKCLQCIGRKSILYMVHGNM